LISIAEPPREVPKLPQFQWVAFMLAAGAPEIQLFAAA
jgi:hypothetical protein